MLAPRRKRIQNRSCWSSSFRPWFLQGTTICYLDPNLPRWPLQTFERLSSTLGILSWAVWRRQVFFEFPLIFFSNKSACGVLFVRQTQPFPNRFCKRNINKVSEKVVQIKSLSPKTEAKKAGSAKKDADETRRPPISFWRASWVLLVFQQMFSLFPVLQLSFPKRAERWTKNDEFIFAWCFDPRAKCLERC